MANANVAHPSDKNKVFAPSGKVVKSVPKDAKAGSEYLIKRHGVICKAVVKEAGSVSFHAISAKQAAEAKESK